MCRPFLETEVNAKLTLVATESNEIMKFARYFSFILLYVGVILASIEVDVSWEFDSSLEGWANATSEEMKMEVRAENGELRASVVGDQAHMDSPTLFIHTTPRHFVVIRMMYSGRATSGQLLLRSGSDVSDRLSRDHKSLYWKNDISVTMFSASPAVSAESGMAALTDRNPYTMYRSTARQAVQMIFDLSEYRWISSLRIQPEGNSSSPRRFLLQKSLSDGLGPFITVGKFMFPERYNVSVGHGRDVSVEEFSGFNEHARFWKIVVLDNYGGSNVGIREVSFDGYSERIGLVNFHLNTTGAYQNYYLPIHDDMQGPLIRMRLQLSPPIVGGTNPKARGKLFREGLSVDYIRIARAPTVWRVRGCLDKYFEFPAMNDPRINVTSVVVMINDQLPLRYFDKNYMTLPYASTYDCPLSGGVEITIDGINFGNFPRVFVGRKEAVVTSVGLAAEGGRVESIVCRLPPGESGVQLVRVQNGVLPGLFQEVPFLTYRIAPPVPAAPIITNIGAHRVDLVWDPPGDMYAHMITTGYKILWFQPQFRSRVSNVTVGNVTTTSIRGLEPGTEYVFAVAAMAEGAVHERSALLATDLYGRREATSDALIGTFSAYTNITATTLYDFEFSFFDANKTVNSSASTSSFSDGPTGNYGGEGHYGLYLAGSTNVENCNVSSTCCDNYNATIGLASCGTHRSVCAVLPARMLEYPYVIDGVTRRQTPQNFKYSSGGLPEINIFTLDELIRNKGADLPSARCGPALRLTPSEARQSGAAWYGRKVDVREGFDTTITFELSNPSFRCDRMDDVNTYCRSRGADGFAFVVQNEGPGSLGLAGSGLGYEGIFNSLAIEVDTYMNYDQMDFYENHISVMTQGWRYNISANHSRSLATTNRVPDLTDGKHTIRIKYEPNFDVDSVPHPSFQTNGFTTWFLENADFPNGGEGDWGVGFGLLYVYLDDMYSPVITTPMNLEATLKLDSGRALVGLTAATGDSHWQAHDILNWRFRSLHIDQHYTPPFIVNGEGGHECVDDEVCVHRVDFDHFNRKNNWWGKGTDSTESWMTGTEGFCAFC